MEDTKEKHRKWIHTYQGDMIGESVTYRVQYFDEEISKWMFLGFSDYILYVSAQKEIEQMKEWGSQSEFRIVRQVTQHFEIHQRGE